jgi:chaperonin cofactor prefoldin
MAQKTLSPATQKTLSAAEDQLNAIGEGLERIRAVANLLFCASPEQEDFENTLQGAAASIKLEVDRLEKILMDTEERLEKLQPVASAAHLEVVRG